MERPLPFREHIPVYPGENRADIPTEASTTLGDQDALMAARLSMRYTTSANSAQRTSAVTDVLNFCDDPQRYLLFRSFIETQVQVTEDRESTAQNEKRLQQYGDLLEKVNERSRPPSNLKIRFRYALHVVLNPDELDSVVEELVEDMRQFFKPGEENIVYMESADGDNVVEDIEARPGAKKYPKYREAFAYNIFADVHNREPNSLELAHTADWLDTYERTELTPSARYLHAVLRATDMLIGEGYQAHIVSEKGNKAQIIELGDRSTMKGFRQYMYATYEYSRSRDKISIKDMYELAKRYHNKKANFYAIFGSLHCGQITLIPAEYHHMASESYATNAWEVLEARIPFALKVMRHLAYGEPISEELWQLAFEENNTWTYGAYNV